MKLRKEYMILLGLLILPTLAFAHSEDSSTSGFLHGFLHPIGGIDHLLAMLAVGVWAAMAQDKSKWIIPASFVGIMALGGILGFAGLAMPLVEEVILLSVLVLGVLIAITLKLPLPAAAVIVGAFALFHGHAHGTELPHAVSAATYAAGFLFSSALINLTGFGIGTMIQKTEKPQLFRLTGMAFTLASVVLIFA
jgi:urease accessory protein